MKISDDKARATLSIDATLTTEEVDSLIRQLSLLRADMNPPVAPTRDALMASGQELTVEDKPALLIAQRASGGFRLWLRHRGFGWIAYELGAAESVGAARYVLSRSGDDGHVDLVGHQEPNRH